MKRSGIKAKISSIFNNIDEARLYKGLLGLLLLSLFIFRWLYISYGPLDLAPDEAHYWEWSRRLDISYYSKGPFVAYIIALFTSIGGTTEFAVRAGAVFISLTITILLYHLGLKIFQRERDAFITAAIPHLTPLFAAGSILMTTDPPLLLFWLLSIYLVYRAVFAGESGDWYLAGITAGLGFLSKYTMAMIYPCILLYLITSKEDRFWLRRKEPYVAFFISLVFFTPVIVWNYQHGWIGMRHVLGQTHIGEGMRISIKDFLEFIGSQAGVLTPFFFIGLLYGMLKGGFAIFNGEKRPLFLFMTSAPVFFFFVLKSLQGKVEANWAAPAYVTAFPLMVGIVSNAFNRGKGTITGLRVIVVVSIVVAAVITGVAHYPDSLRYIGIEIPPKKNPLRRLIGWEELGREVGDIYNSTGEDVFIVSDRYQIASELAFYVQENPTVFNIDMGRRMNQYDVWGGLERMKGRDAIYVRWDRGVRGTERFFERCGEETRLDIVRGGSKVREFYIYRCYNFKGPVKVEEREF